MERDRDKDWLKCSWDGDQSTFGDYIRRVRLAFAKTPKNKRKFLGPELVSQLSGRAWVVTQEVAHDRLVQADGAKYLVEFLESRLARVPVPDAGSRAEDLLVKMRRAPGMSMSTWCHNVREAYRRLQRALKRARQEQEPSPLSSPTTSPPSRTPSRTSRSSTKTRSRTMSPTRSSSAKRQWRKGSKATVPEPEAADEEFDDGEEDEEVPDSPLHDDFNEEDEEENLSETKKGKAGRRSHTKKKDSSTSEDEDDWGIHLWSDLDTGLPEVLPSEIIGWLMLRRSNLTSQQRLNILSTTGNSLKEDDIERALRGAEYELRANESEHKGKGKGGKKPRLNFWVEQDGEWGLLAIEDSEGQEWMEDGQVHWVGTNIGHIYAQTTLPSTSSTWEDGDDAEADGFWHQDDRGGYTWWQQEADGEFYHLDNGGTYWPWSEQAFWSATPEEQKEIQEAYAAYENKVRSFTDSRALMKHKTLSRGFYPKGKGKNKGGFGKGKGFQRPRPSSSSSSSTNTAFAAQ